MASVSRTSDDLQLAKWNIHRPGDLPARCATLDSGGWLIEDILKQKELGIVVGASGLGKTPLLYQMAVCIAGGVPFLGRKTNAGTVLYMDYENGLADVSDMVQRISGHLGLESPPENLLLWNLNDCHESWGTTGNSLHDMVWDVRPDLVIIDTLSSALPEAEGKNEQANGVYRDLRDTGRDAGSAILPVHHIRKPGADAGAVRLKEGGVKSWLHSETRGASSLINGADLRLAVDDGNGENVELVLGGYRRVRGETPFIRLERARDGDGVEIGYREMSGVALLANPAHQAAYNQLPDEFTFTEAKHSYGKASQPTNNLLLNCLSAGILRKNTIGKGYQKVKTMD